jgi:hypothetical protein
MCVTCDWLYVPCEFANGLSSRRQVGLQKDPFVLNHLQVCAAGALLAILHRDDLLSSAPSGQDDMENDAEFLLSVEHLAECSLSGQLIVDAPSMRALQIFEVSALIYHSRVPLRLNSAVCCPDAA